MTNVVTVPNPVIPDTPRRGKIREAKERRRLNLIERGWEFDGLWWHSPHTGIRYDFQTACDVEYLRDEWSGPQALDWERAVWANQYGSGGEDMWEGEPVW